MIRGTDLRLPATSALATLAVCALFLVAAGVRLIGIDKPPGGLSSRFYRSAVVARADFLKDRSDASAWKREVAEINKDRLSLFEPRIMEGLAVAGYRIGGAEHLWIPRLLASVFWLIGGWFLFRIAALLISMTAAVVALGAYLLLPFAVEASRSFQPDPLMVCTMLAALYALVRYDLAPSPQRLIVAGALAGLSVYVKPGATALFIAGAYLSLTIARLGLRRAILSWELPVFAVLAAAPALIFLLATPESAPAQAGAGGGRELAEGGQEILLHSAFWKDWAARVANVLGSPGATIGNAVGVLVALLAAIGAWFHSGRAKPLIIGLVAGYVTYALAFPSRISVHSYYHLPLIPIVALCLGAFGAWLIDALRPKRLAPLWGAASAAVLIALLAVLIPLARNNAFPGTSLQTDSPTVATRQLAGIGRIVHHTSRAILLDNGDGIALEYYGYLSGMRWAVPPKDVPSETPQKVVGRIRDGAAELDGPAQYFIVTALPSFHSQVDLVHFLDTHARRVRDPDPRIYRIYRLPPIS